MSPERAPTLDWTELPPEEVDKELQALGLHLKPEDYRQLCRRLERKPTLAELTLMDSMWSEHCSYKSTRALLRTLPTQASNVVLGPGADAGIVCLPGSKDPADGARPCLAVAHESHNHPSQLLPYEGAATGIGGIVRDVYCMGANVVGVLDVLRFGDPEGQEGELVRQIARGVVDGIAGYGNALGVPNLGGEVVFDRAFDDNCLVNVVAFGVLDEREIIPSRAPVVAGSEQYALVLAGKPTDDSGLGGAAFASGLLDTSEETQERGAVQLPDPFFKRVLTEANLEAFELLRRHGAPFAVKDLGAAGLGGASSELAGLLGLDVDLDAVHADQPDRGAAVLLVAETQERYVMAVPKEICAELIDIYEKKFELGSMVRGAGARVIGEFNESGRYVAVRHGETHVEVPTELITTPLEIDWPRSPLPPRVVHDQAQHGLGNRDLDADLENMLRAVNGASRYGVFAHYDSDVQGHTLLRPGDADAGVVVPDRRSGIGIAVGIGSSARLGREDAWRAGAQAVVGACRNVVAVGATPWALTDCLNFGSPESPEGASEIAEAVRGLAEAATTLGLRQGRDEAIPFVSGNVSLYNANLQGKDIPPTPIVACFGLLTDASSARCHSFAAADDLLVRLGRRTHHLGGSFYAEATRQERLLRHDALPELDLAFERQLHACVLELHEAGCLTACHASQKGGDFLALLRMAFTRRGEAAWGFEWQVDGDGQSASVWLDLFAESNSFWCGIAAENREKVEEVCERHRVPVSFCGRVLSRPQATLIFASGASRSWNLTELGGLWGRGLERVLREGAHT